MERIKRSLIVLPIVCLGVLGAAGCARQSVGEQAKPIVIQFWDYQRGTDLNRWEEEQIAWFEQTHSNVKIEATRLAWQSGPEKLDVAVFSGNPPDVAGSALNIAYVEQGLIEPWDDLLSPEDMADFYPTALNACTWEGRLWAIPWYKTAYIMMLNLDLFRETGVEPPKGHRWTWEEFLEKMKQLTVDKDGDGMSEQYGIGINFYPEEFESWAFLYNEGTEILSPDGRRCVFDSPETLRGVENLYDLVHKYKVALSGSGAMRQYETWDVFTNEWRIAATCQGLWSVFAQRRTNRRIEQAAQRGESDDAGVLRGRIMDFDVALFPSSGTAEPILASAGVGHLVIFKQKDPEKKKLCVEFAKHMTSGDSQKMLATQSLFPARRSAGDLYEHDPILSFVQPYVAKAKVHPLHPEWVNIDRTLSKQLQLAMLGEKPIAEAIRDGATQVQALLDRYYERRRERR